MLSTVLFYFLFSIIVRQIAQKISTKVIIMKTILATTLLIISLQVFAERPTYQLVVTTQTQWTHANTHYSILRRCSGPNDTTGHYIHIAVNFGNETIPIPPTDGISTCTDEDTEDTIEMDTLDVNSDCVEFAHIDAPDGFVSSSTSSNCPASINSSNIKVDGNIIYLNMPL